jgi:superfamily II DNA or RNA helicase
MMFETPQPSSKNIGLSKDPFALSPVEEVLRHQLNILDYWKERNPAHVPQALIVSEGVHPPVDASVTGRWELLKGIDLREWQKECADTWFRSGKRGVVKVVTGAGKTVMALGIIERLQNTEAPDLRVAIVVPTVVLQDQWYELIRSSGNLPESWIGRLGGGNQDSFESEVRILICVLNSASTKLPKIAESLNVPLLLVVDECHRAGSKQMSEIFKARRAFSLGLSATPERDWDIQEDDEISSPDPDPVEPESFDESLVGTELGPIIHELGYREALDAGILAKFEIRHFGLPLEPVERAKYEKMSRDITELRRSLQSSPSARGINGGALVGWARRIAAKGGGLSEQAASYVSLTGQRKRLVYRSTARTKAVIRLVREALAAPGGARILLFHESVEEVMRLFAELRLQGVAAVAEHSQLSDTLRAGSLHLFRTGSAQVLVSARSLIEGFDVPAADVGIVVASSSSIRQRIQTLGRILRKKKGEEERAAALHVLYMAQTTDETIYEKQDWASITGADRNRYYTWDPSVEDSVPLEKEGPPRTPKPTEDQVDFTALRPGDAYPGAYEGEEFSADSQGNIKDVAGRLCSNPQGVPALLDKLRGSLGRFRVTLKRRALILPGGEGKLIFGGILEEPFTAIKEESGSSVNALGWTDLSVKSKTDGIRIVLKVPGGEEYARTTPTAVDPVRGADAGLIIDGIAAMEKETGIKVRKLKLLRDLSVVAELSGHVKIVANLSKGLEFQSRNIPDTPPVP